VAARPPAFAPKPLKDEAERRAKMEQMRRRATGLLVFAGVVFLVARLFEPAHPWLGFIRATAEASLVGGLADWFAVTALFRKPLGLPIPHTAIIPTQKDRIGRILGNFLQEHFLTRDVIAAKIRSVHLAERVARWMSDPAESKLIAKHIAAGLARAIQSLPDEEVTELIRKSAANRLQATRIAPILSDVLALLTTERRHQDLLNEAARLIAQTIEENQIEIRLRIAEQSPWWVPGVVDDKIYQKIMSALEDLLEELRTDPRHPLRLKFDIALEDFIDRLKNSPEVIAKAEALKEKLVDQPVFEEFAASLWHSARRAAARYSANPDAKSPDALEQAIITAGESLLTNPAVLEEFEEFLSRMISSAVEQHRHEVAEFLAQTVSRWDPEVASQRLELVVGRDLQFIRINGTLVGGLVGLLIYTISLLLS
jgi:uncharacterized membrane-anchored protein YjiN (DUF445 family)